MYGECLAKREKSLANSGGYLVKSEKSLTNCVGCIANREKSLANSGECLAEGEKSFAKSEKLKTAPSKRNPTFLMKCRICFLKLWCHWFLFFFWCNPHFLNHLGKGKLILFQAVVLIEFRSNFSNTDHLAINAVEGVNSFLRNFLCH